MNEWPVNKAVIDLPVMLKGNSKLISGNGINLDR